MGPLTQSLEEIQRAQVDDACQSYHVLLLLFSTKNSEVVTDMQ